MASKKETNEQAVWRVFMNAPGPEAVTLYETATKILTSRNIIKPPRKRKELPPGTVVRVRSKESAP